MIPIESLTYCEDCKDEIKSIGIKTITCRYCGKKEQVDLRDIDVCNECCKKKKICPRCGEKVKVRKKTTKNTVTIEPKKRRGRPKKENTDEKIIEQSKKKRGRPKKIQEEVIEQPKRKRGRPRKIKEETPQIKRKRGRPRKSKDNEQLSLFD